MGRSWRLGAVLAALTSLTLIGVVALTGTLGASELGASASARATRPAAHNGPNPLANPGGNRQPPALSVSTGLCTLSSGRSATWDCPSPCFPHPRTGHGTTTSAYNGSAACTDLLLGAINQAQVAEHEAPLTVPADFLSLSVTRQMFVLVNLERIARHVPPMAGLSPYLNGAATTAAQLAQDPSFKPAYGPVHVWAPPGGGYYAFGGAWSGNAVNAAAAVFGWMYDDGWGGRTNTSNGACTSPTAPGCWGHRDELLGEYSGTGCPDCVAGSGYAATAEHNWRESYDFVVVRPAVFPTPLVFTWNSDVLPHLPPGWERERAA